MRRVPEHMTANARALRNRQTEAERLIWRRLSCYRPRFTRQLVVGPYILDIACRSAKLAIELDGSQHLNAEAYDARRSLFLQQTGWTVLRYWNGELLANPDGVTEDILTKTAERLGGTHPNPSLPGRGERRGNHPSQTPQPHKPPIQRGTANDPPLPPVHRRSRRHRHRISARNRAETRQWRSLSGARLRPYPRHG
nr:DUF559 domain-containing protein [Sphingomonas sp. KC8]